MIDGSACRPHKFASHVRYFLVGVAMVMTFGAGYALGAYRPQLIPIWFLPANPPAMIKVKPTDGIPHDAVVMQAKIDQLQRELCDSRELLDLPLRKMREGLSPGAIAADLEILKANQRARREMRGMHGADRAEQHSVPTADCQLDG
jgi:hypothetical protein